jgi:NADPH:quinone reductase-like Zn-dependent oxidoreductase
MKALVLHSYGPPDVLERHDVDKPVPAGDEVLVRVRATSVNPWDWHKMRGQPYFARLIAGEMGLRCPRLSVLGCDMAGHVEATGPQASGFRPGDDVFALLAAGGGFGEYVSVPEGLLARKPSNLSYEQAAAVPMGAVTALLAVREQGLVQPGQQVLVNGASGHWRAGGR